MQRTLQECIERYGPIVNGTWRGEKEWCDILYVDSRVAKAMVNTTTKLPAYHLYCNRDMMAPLTRAFCSVLLRGFLDELHTYDGCLEIRNVRGDEELSTHAYALGIDLNARQNPLGSDGRWTAGFVRCFTDEGFTWGGDFKTRKDPMHFSYAWE